MLDTSRVSEIAEKVASEQAEWLRPQRVVTESIVDSAGNDALRITVILSKKATERFDGNDAIDLLVGIRNKLDAEGESRLPIIEYATEGDYDAKPETAADED